MSTRRRHGLAAALAAGLALALSAAAVRAGEAVEVWKTPTCGCCKGWVSHLRNAGFDVTAHDVVDVTPEKTRLGVPPALGSCHTAVVGGYFVEGHVPAADVERLLAERPDIAGIAVPGMPMGSPGMEFGPPVPYDVIAVGRDGSVRVFSSHGR